MSESENNSIMQLMELENDFKLEAVNTLYDLANGYIKIGLTNDQKCQMSNVIQHLPEMFATSSMANAYIAKFPDGINRTLASLKQGGFMSFWKKENGQFGGTASLYSLKSEALLLSAFSAMAFASGQYFITQVNSELQKINQNIDKILEFLYGDKKAELLSEVSFVKYAYENFSSIMAHDEQRVATIASLQEAKKVAIKDAEFYMNDLDLTVNGKDGIEKLVGNAFQIKESLELSIQLYGMSTILETYFSQNYDTEFIKYIDREMTAYIDKCEKRMLSGFSILKKHIADYKGRWLEKIDKSQYEKDVCELIDSLNNGEESAMRKTLRKTLRAVSEVKEFYISQSGDVYLKKI